MVGAGVASWGIVLGKDGDYATAQNPWNPKLVHPLSRAFVESWIKKYDSPPTLENVLGYLKFMIFRSAVERAGSLDREKVRKALLETDEETVIGRLRVDKEKFVGRFITPIYIEQWQNAEREIVWPKEYATSDLWYPQPPWSKQG